MKQRLKEEGADQLLTKLKSPKDGKRYPADVVNIETLLRIIQSVPSKKAEPFKLWLARVGAGRIEETIDPEQAIDRALETYQKKGYSDEWIHQRLLSIRVRNALTEEWQKSLHLKNIFICGELVKASVIEKISATARMEKYNDIL